MWRCGKLRRPLTDGHAPVLMEVKTMQRLFVSIGLVLTASTAVAQLAGAQEPSVVFDHRLLATNRTSTMQKEMREAAEAGYRFAGVMGGETSFGGSEVVVVMSRNPEVARGTVYDY